MPPQHLAPRWESLCLWRLNRNAVPMQSIEHGTCSAADQSSDLRSVRATEHFPSRTNQVTRARYVIRSLSAVVLLTAVNVLRDSAEPPGDVFWFNRTTSRMLVADF
jgi:hypothetical protein